MQINAISDIKYRYHTLDDDARLPHLQIRADHPAPTDSKSFVPRPSEASYQDGQLRKASRPDDL